MPLTKSPAVRQDLGDLEAHLIQMGGEEDMLLALAHGQHDVAVGVHRRFRPGGQAMQDLLAHRSFGAGDAVAADQGGKDGRRV